MVAGLLILGGSGGEGGGPKFQTKIIGGTWEKN